MSSGNSFIYDTYQLTSARSGISELENVVKKRVTDDGVIKPS